MPETTRITIKEAHKVVARVREILIEASYKLKEETGFSIKDANCITTNGGDTAGDPYQVEMHIAPDALKITGRYYRHVGDRESLDTNYHLRKRLQEAEAKSKRLLELCAQYEADAAQDRGEYDS